MRVDLKKYLFVGLQNQRHLFFQKAQEIGVIHFNSTSKVALPDAVQHLHHALKVIGAQTSIPQEKLEGYEKVEDLVKEILDLDQKLKHLQNEKRELLLEIEHVQPLGHFTTEDIDWIARESGHKLQFFSAKQGKQNQSTELFYVNTDGNHDYFLSISPESKSYAGMTEIVPKAPLRDLQEHLSALDTELEQQKQLLKDKARFNAYLQEALIHQLDHHHLHLAIDGSGLVLDEMLFVAEGWVPATKIDALQKLFTDLHLHSEEIAIQQDDKIPTYLENTGLARVGEDLVHIYDTPSKDDKDPSLWVLFFFALFFAMIVGDGGYGLILLLAALFARYKYGKISATGQRTLKLTFFLAAAVMVWGVLTTSFFGITVSPDNPVRKVSLLSWLVEKKTAYHFSANDDIAKSWIAKFPDLNEIVDPQSILSVVNSVKAETGRISYDLYNLFANDLMLELALMIGVIHLLISLLRYLKRNPAALGWMAFIIGGYLYCPKFLNATSIVHFAFGLEKATAAYTGIILMVVGLGFAILVNLFKNGLVGIVDAVMLIVQIFGDAMSYLRLYALGLSGSLITATVNDLVDGMNIIVAAVLLIVTHSVNFILALMGGVIHGLRLNFLEWYHYSFEGGGKRYSPLKKIGHDLKEGTSVLPLLNHAKIGD